MSYQSTNWSPRTKGLKVKHVFQLALVLAVGIWLLYQFNQPQDKKDYYDGNSEDRLSDKNGISGLGRKEKAGFKSELNDRNFDGESEGKEDGGGEDDDELDRNSKESREDEVPIEEGEDTEENATNYKEEESENEQEGQHKGDEEDNGDSQMRGGDKGKILLKDIHEEEGAEKEEESQHEEEKNDKEDNDGSKPGSRDEMEISNKDAREGKDSEGGTEGGTVVNQSEMSNVTQEFEDENGFPKEGDDNPVSSTIDQMNTIDQKTISDTDSQSDHEETVMPELDESTKSPLPDEQNEAEKKTNDQFVENEKAEIQKGDDVLMADTTSNGASEGLKTDASVHGETKATSEMEEGHHTDLDSSTSISQKEKGEVPDSKILLETKDEERNIDELLAHKLK